MKFQEKIKKLEFSEVEIKWNEIHITARSVHFYNTLLKHVIIDLTCIYIYL